MGVEGVQRGKGKVFQRWSEGIGMTMTTAMEDEKQVHLLSTRINRQTNPPPLLSSKFINCLRVILMYTGVCDAQNISDRSTPVQNLPAGAGEPVVGEGREGDLEDGWD